VHTQSFWNNERYLKTKNPSIWAMSVNEHGGKGLLTQGKHSHRLIRKCPGRNRSLGIGGKQNTHKQRNVND
jgi:hypothetical protein